MSFYSQRIFPWRNDTLTSEPRLRELRAEALQPAHGRVVEIGFGSGPNVPLYPETVTSIVAIEPNAGMRNRLAGRAASEGFSGRLQRVRMVAARAEHLPLRDASFDTAVSMLTLCSVSDPGRVLRELRRVLREDGRLIVLEHGLAEDEGVARWQYRLNGLQKRLACGCQLTRPVAALIEAQGFERETLKTFYAPGVPRTHGWIATGTWALSPD